MTRTAAREIAIQICYASLISGTPVDEVTDALFAPEYFTTLSEENEIFRTKPNEKQLSYIRALTGQTDSHLEELNSVIENTPATGKLIGFPKWRQRFFAVRWPRFCIWTRFRFPSRSMKRWSLRRDMKSRRRFLLSTGSSAALYVPKRESTP